MNQVECPVCKSLCQKSFAKPPGTYFCCESCKSVFLSPMPTVEQMKEYANAQYREGVYSDYLKAKSLKIHTFQRRLAQVVSLLPRESSSPIRHLDVGCSAGFMIEVGLQNGFDSYGVEFSKEAIAQALPDVQKRITHGDVNQLMTSGVEPFTLITCFDIVEHVQDPKVFLQSLRKVLKPGGVLVLTTPDPEHFLAKMMGQRWPMLQPMQHTILFSKKGLRSVLESTGFDQIENAPAYKVLTLDYLTGQLQELNPVLSKVMAFTSKVIPRKLAQKPLGLNISEFMSISRGK